MPVPSLLVPQVSLEDAVSSCGVRVFAPVSPAVVPGRRLRGLQLRFPDISRLTLVVRCSVRLDPVAGRAGRNRVGLVVADRGDLSAQSQSALDGFEETANDVAVGRDLDLDDAVPITVHDRVRLASLVVEILGHIQRPVVPFRAQGPATLVDLVRMSTGRAMTRVTSKGLHDVQFVITRQTRIDRVVDEVDFARRVEG